MQVLIHWQKQIPGAFPLIFSIISEYETNCIIAIQSKAKELKSICFHEIRWPTMRNFVEKTHQCRRWPRHELLLISNLNCLIHFTSHIYSASWKPVWSTDSQMQDFICHVKSPLYMEVSLSNQKGPVLVIGDFVTLEDKHKISKNKHLWYPVFPKVALCYFPLLKEYRIVLWLSPICLFMTECPTNWDLCQLCISLLKIRADESLYKQFM